MHISPSAPAWRASDLRYVAQLSGVTLPPPKRFCRRCRHRPKVAEFRTQTPPRDLRETEVGAEPRQTLLGPTPGRGSLPGVCQNRTKLGRFRANFGRTWPDLMAFAQFRPKLGHKYIPSDPWPKFGRVSGEDISRMSLESSGRTGCGPRVASQEATWPPSHFCALSKNLALQRGPGAPGPAESVPLCGLHRISPESEQCAVFLLRSDPIYGSESGEKRRNLHRATWNLGGQLASCPRLDPPRCVLEPALLIRQARFGSDSAGHGLAIAEGFLSNAAFRMPGLGLRACARARAPVPPSLTVCTST